MALLAKLAKGGSKEGKRSLTDTNLLLIITVVVFILMYLFAMVVLGKGFLKWQTFFNILNANAPLLITACGLTIVMICGSIDISVGGVVGLVTMCCAVNLDYQGGSPLTALLIALGIGLAFGLIQGFLVAYLDIQPFIVTLAGMFFARGMTTIVHTEPFNVENEAFGALMRTRIYIPFLGSPNNSGVFMPAYMEIGVAVALIIVVLLFVGLRWTSLGRSFYALGGNRQSALMLGINTKRSLFLAHLISGLLAGIAGFVYIMHSGSGAVTNASGMEMNAIAASIIGGTMLTGGVGNIAGTFFGVLSLSTIQNIVSSAGFDEAWWSKITVAAMICLFLVIQSVVLARKKQVE
ncbi:ABC transporter permease [Collinsella tanakaei]|uniref:ABC transporter permease n=1 Tax=Collinsella tanakaei TaxID=626935 RepID=UPI001F2FF5D8|nr:sugar ABC transporter permease YjfF [Collinsella tanakaei]MCF2622385.1 sugar ABC transporter permease YjfF [Collinsella tanakaei]MDM8299370.1 sugar ABC transporter permease YjfF [Collinsella tanakaei]MDM8302783.1 sugar ABC transporter permease YjfF [Collinsella tanakaei]